MALSLVSVYLFPKVLASYGFSAPVLEHYSFLKRNPAGDVELYHSKRSVLDFTHFPQHYEFQIHIVLLYSTSEAE